MNPKKVAYVATVYSHLAVFHIPYMKMLASQGYEVHAYASPDHCRSDVEQESIVCHDVEISRNPFSLRNLKALKQLTKQFRQERYSLIHVHTPNASVICRIAAKWAGCKNIIYTAHGFHFYQGAPLLNWLLYYPVEWLLSRWTDVIITINNEDYERVKKFPVRNKAVFIPGVGVDIDKYRDVRDESVANVRNELGLNGTEFVVLSVAELNRNKNHEQFIHALHKLSLQGIPIVGLIAGVGEKEMDLKSLVAELGMEQNIIFLGFRRDISVLMQLAEVIVLMSEREGFPKVLLEAMAAGKPMVVTDVRGNRELVTSYENGFRVPYGDVAATVLALTKLYSEPDLRQEFGRNSKEKAIYFDIPHIEEKLKTVYSENMQLPLTAV